MGSSYLIIIYCKLPHYGQASDIIIIIIIIIIMIIIIIIIIIIIMIIIIIIIVIIIIIIIRLLKNLFKKKLIRGLRSPHLVVKLMFIIVNQERIKGTEKAFPIHTQFHR